MKFIKYLILIVLFTKCIADPITKQWDMVDEVGNYYIVYVTALDGVFPSTNMSIRGSSTNARFGMSMDYVTLDLGSNLIPKNPATIASTGKIMGDPAFPFAVTTEVGKTYIKISRTAPTPDLWSGTVTFVVTYQ